MARARREAHGTLLLALVALQPGVAGCNQLLDITEPTVVAYPSDADDATGSGGADATSPPDASDDGPASSRPGDGGPEGAPPPPDAGGGCANCSPQSCCVDGQCIAPNDTCPDGQVCFGGICGCSSINCPGCCSAGGMCVPPTASACGTPGATCMPCVGNQECIDGVCTEEEGDGGEADAGAECSSANCAGCCSGTTCVLQASETACGSGGEACAPCGSGTSCEGLPAGGGTCTPTVCDSTTCSGCCDAVGGCIPVGSTTAAQCGLNGATCVACSAGPCVGGSCGQCAAGQTQCAGDGVQSCVGGVWGASVACTGSTPVCSSGACVACAPGATQCSGNGVASCTSNGTWSGTTPCTNQTCVDGVCSGVCAPNQVQCSGNGIATCTASGTWSSPAACTNQACVGGVCTGVCAPGTTSCVGSSTPETCGATGQWGTATPCTGSTPYCASGGCSSTPPSCQSAGPGTSACGASSESCCTSLSVAGGTYDRTYSSMGSDGGPTGEADPASVSTFLLDKYAVTVARFRPFVAAWSLGWRPPAGSGIHTHLNGGSGLVNVGNDAGTTYETGWLASDDANASPQSATGGTYSSTPGTNDALPMTGANWYEAYAFCIWDGGFLPSEAEWEYATAGGSQQLEYPWGSAAPGDNSQYAIYDCYYPTGFANCGGADANIAPVGTATLGAGVWGQLDLVGNAWQWVLDYYGGPYVDPCTDCAYLSANYHTAGFLTGIDAYDRVFRGAAFDVGTSPWFSAAWRAYDPPSTRDYRYGFRCARAP